MVNPDDSLSYGGYLQRIRLEKHIRLEDVSQETRIAIGILKLIEKEDHGQLPAEVFVKGFLRAYARAIGADEDEAVTRYEARIKTVGQLSGVQAKQEKSNSGVWWKLSLLLVVFAMVVLLSIWASSMLQTQSGTKATVAEKKDLKDKPSDMPPGQAAGASGNNSSKQTAKEKWVLRAEAQGDTWIKVIIDGGEAVEYDLTTGDHLELKALSNFNLLIGNASEIKMTLNGKSVGLSGKNGEIVTLQLP
jgi:cytoskeletal protein RodZ